MTTSSLPTPAKSGKDAILADAVDRAREAAHAEAGPDFVGEHLGFVLADTRLGTHYFDCTNPGYVGWRWAVTVTRIPRSRTATVSESSLEPGPTALLAKDWLPWAERLAPGDVKPTDRLPYQRDDARLEPGFTATGDPAVDQVAIVELGLERNRVATRSTLDEAADRWLNSDQGPDSPGAKEAGANCQTCGFLVPISGRLGTLFGVCINEWSPDDGKVVSYDHGCGAHSETDVDDEGPDWVQSEPVINDGEIDIIESLDVDEPAADGTPSNETAGDEPAAVAAEAANTVEATKAESDVQ